MLRVFRDQTSSISSISTSRNYIDCEVFDMVVSRHSSQDVVCMLHLKNLIKKVLANGGSKHILNAQVSIRSPCC